MGLGRRVPSTADRLTIGALITHAAEVRFEAPLIPKPIKVYVFISGASTSYLEMLRFHHFELMPSYREKPLMSDEYALACATDRNMYIGKAVLTKARRR